MSHKELFSPCLPADSILDGPEDLEFYGKDSCHQYKSNASLILLPRSSAEVQAILRICNQHKLALVPSGGRTGYSGGATATAGEVVLSLARMNRILDINTFDQTISCEAGVTTEAIRNKAQEHGLYYPVDFASKGSSHIGGNVATNAGGIRVIRYGNTKDWVLGLKVVTATGEEMVLNGALYKNQTGYDLRSLFVGSEGTLGIITEVTLKLTAPPKESSLAMAGVENLKAALEALRCLRQAGFVVNVFEYFERNALELVVKHAGLSDPLTVPHSCYVLIEVETPFQEERERFQANLVDMLQKDVIVDVVIAESQKQRQNLMALRERISESIGRHHVPHKNDISVPISSIPDFVDSFRSCLEKQFPNFSCIIFGHLGDGNLHLNILKPEAMEEEEFFRLCDDADRETFSLIKKYSGSISAEHGVGLLKKEFLKFSRSDSEIAAMKQVKKLFDPNNILNPGKIF